MYSTFSQVYVYIRYIWYVYISVYMLADEIPLCKFLGQNSYEILNKMFVVVICGLIAIIRIICMFLFMSNVKHFELYC